MANHTTSILSLKASSSETRTGFIYITPNEGYVVSASAFEVSESITELTTLLADTTTAGAIGNQIKVTVTLTNYTVTADGTINLTISDSAVPYVEITEVPITLTILPGLINNTSGPTIEVTTGTLAGGLSESGGVITGTTPIETENLEDLIYIADIVTTVDAEDTSGTDITSFLTSWGSVLDNQVSFNFSTLLFEVTSTTVGTDPDLEGFGGVTSVTESVYLDIKDNVEEYLNADHTEGFTVNTSVKYKESVDVTSLHVDSISLGSDLISIKGETKTISVYGDAGAAFTIDWDASDAASSQTSGTIPANEKFNNGKGVYTESIVIPSATSSKSFELWLVAGANTTLKSGIPSASSKATFNQYVNPTLTMTTSTTDTTAGGRTWSLPADIVYTGRPLVEGSSIDYLRGVDSVFDIEYNMTNTTVNMQLIDQPVTTDWAVSPDDSTKTVLIFTNMSTAVSGTTGTVKATVRVVNWGSANTTYTLNLDNLINEARG